MFFIVPFVISSKAGKNNKEAEAAKKKHSEAFKSSGGDSAQAYKYGGSINSETEEAFYGNDHSIPEKAVNTYTAVPSKSAPDAVKPLKNDPYAVKPSISEPYAVKPSVSEPYTMKPAAKSSSDASGLSNAMRNLSPAACGVVWAEIIGKPKAMQ